MLTPIYALATFAQGESGNTDLFSALGLDVRLLILQTLAFLVLVFILGKFAYPPILKAIDDRRTKIEAGLQDAKQAAADLKSVEQKVSEILRDARKEAGEIITRSQQESAATVEAAQEKAVRRAETIVEQAQAQMESEVAAARKALRQETVQLVAQATEKIIKQKIDAQTDAQLIAASLGEVR